MFCSFHIFVFWFLVTLVAWFSFHFFCLAHLALQNVNKDYVIFPNFLNFAKSDQKPKTKNGMNKTLANFSLPLFILYAWKLLKFSPVLLLYSINEFSYQTHHGLILWNRNSIFYEVRPCPSNPNLSWIYPDFLLINPNSIKAIKTT